MLQTMAGVTEIQPCVLEYLKHLFICYIALGMFCTLPVLAAVFLYKLIETLPRNKGLTPVIF